MASLYENTNNLDAGTTTLAGEDELELEYNPNRLLDILQDHLSLRNDAALCRVLEVAPPTVSKIRHLRLPITASILLRMHEVSELSIRDLRWLMGDRRKFFRAEGLLQSVIS